MLQQTQVATVIDYYNRWMTKWPTLQELAKAKLEEVNEMWSGLGYYSRGKRLHEGAKKVVNELEGQVPKSAADLEKKLPGVGRYTAGAIASIALGEKTGVVDGNVIRVFSRLRMIGADVSSPATMDKFWELANELADCERTGDLNQGLMELGAMVCTPKSPKCSLCPLQETCRAFAKVNLEKKQAAGRLISRESDQCGLLDIECLADACQWCLPSDEPWDKSLGVQNLPRKAKKKAPREQMAAVTVVCKLGKDSQQQFLLMKRPEKGLLAGLWEFPNFDVKGEAEISTNSEDILQRLKNNHSVEVASAENVKTVGDVLHLFSHIHQTYCVTLVSVTEQNIKVTSQRPWQWLTNAEVNEAAIPTAMKKVFSACMKVLEGRNDVQGKKRKRNETGQSDAKQRSIDSFFKCK
ncbi:adenine DNA glycosylase-like [Pomacea canaliculata]|uniref:adenine DNA glycosylase-like n=1 Tax=Pomacea canaliculata TaxID=400727 RepID=UPI000D73958D|nr:adenine DNA glycosylase-like [Pomacea canaliculata]